MKRLVQLFLFGFLIVICFYFYKNYLRKEAINDDNTKESLVVDNDSNLLNKNNIIKNLSYEVNLIGNKKYIIKAQESEILNQDDSESVNMNFVIAEYIDEEKIPIVITSDQATFNTLNYDSRFKKNVKITYSNHLIEAQNVYIDFKNNIILIKESIRYEGPLIFMKSDNIKIDLLTKNISIYMDKKFKNIILRSKN
jgi:hypothetical protein